MSRKKRKTPPGQVQASARAWIWFFGMSTRSSGKGCARWYWRGGDYAEHGESLEACVAAIRKLGFGAYTYEGKTYRLRSRYVAGDRPPP